MTWKEGRSPSCGYQSLVAGKEMTKADKLARKLIIPLQRDNYRKIGRIEKINKKTKETRGLRRVKRAKKVFD